ncbi:hypothetical protein RD110_12805 [Rhodoferax koreense]|uniref:Uncharacterized protein n=1 Tax=Rhodoferax koreensis TaxID=1842727 RepID=A0A1P8JW31_9BURK|nr:hypothetical protein [Rhodoferax koreense]APW37962.1 hypothetical protein RD110_12805 [Rhodoferax koreense]
MPKPHHHATELWAIEGQFTQLIYSPKGGIEGLLIDTDGTPTQFVTDPQDASVGEMLRALQPGQQLRIEGAEEGPSPKGESAHFVYRLARVAAIDGVEPTPAVAHAKAKGRVLRFNYAKHGEPNGVVLDNGDFVHTRPDGLAALGLQIGDQVVAEGPARPLATGEGRVIEAHSVNGQPFGPGQTA